MWVALIGFLQLTQIECANKKVKHSICITHGNGYTSEMGTCQSESVQFERLVHANRRAYCYARTLAMLGSYMTVISCIYKQKCLFMNLLSVRV